MAQLLLFYLLLLWLGGMLLAGNLLCLPLVAMPARLRQPLMQRLISAVFRLFLSGCTACGLMQLDLAALDELNARRGGLLIVANHPSMIDVFLILSRVREALCLMKADLVTNAFLAIGALLAGYVSNSRPEHLIRAATRAVRRGQRLLVFPEGTRTVEDPVNPLKPGAGLIAKLAHAPLQVVILRTNSQYLCKGWPIWRAPRFPVVYQARLGPCVPAPRHVGETMAALHEAFRQQLPTASIDPDFKL
ncbi:lysophospholipid acyltransferase family protein [Ideonella oryzae]|uniref:1-acyl-sn-glycerol-3-phosphate acyltransferase n=1 Tax=Ideonella oryzae TaxID=2937441 RepID=A0ABT1BII3_9BURK|nr:lysophospholipid acyltransferase family protein [Ideonella oryzae]MCO5976022.1 1-acyl-sn-glycerol-3-phosphate acyltransferase [Ideonella oryzae]